MVTEIVPVTPVASMMCGLAAVAVLSALASSMALRSEPAPLLLVLLTVKVAPYEEVKNAHRKVRIRSSCFTRVIDVKCFLME